MKGTCVIVCQKPRVDVRAIIDKQLRQVMKIEAALDEVVQGWMLGREASKGRRQRGRKKDGWKTEAKSSPTSPIPAPVGWR